MKHIVVVCYDGKHQSFTFYAEDHEEAKGYAEKFLVSIIPGYFDVVEVWDEADVSFQEPGISYYPHRHEDCEKVAA